MQNDTITHTPRTEHPRPPKEGWRSIVSTILILMAAPLIAWILTVFVFQSYEVEGPSMETTLQNRDRLIVWKLGKTWARLTNQTYIPQRGDIVIFHRPNDAGAATEGNKQLIKRVVALPGERVVVEDKVLTVYNKQFPNGFQPDEAGSYEITTATSGNIDLVVPGGQVFVCGDNRDNSLDSRNFGPVATDQIVGNLAIRVYPFNKFDTF